MSRIIFLNLNKSQCFCPLDPLLTIIIKVLLYILLGAKMGLFDVDEEKLQALYHRAWH